MTISTYTTFYCTDTMCIINNNVSVPSNYISTHIQRIIVYDCNNWFGIVHYNSIKVVFVYHGIIHNQICTIYRNKSFCFGFISVVVNMSIFNFVSETCFTRVNLIDTRNDYLVRNIISVRINCFESRISINRSLWNCNSITSVHRNFYTFGDFLHEKFFLLRSNYNFVTWSVCKYQYDKRSCQCISCNYTCKCQFLFIFHVYFLCIRLLD